MAAEKAITWLNLERNRLLNERSNTIMRSAALRYEKKRVNVLGRQMAYVEVGSGNPIVFLHGTPTSSYLWRNVIPHLQELGRCLAPDLVGMGDSEKLPDSGPGSYTLVEHSRYLDALFEELGVNELVTLVIHDWGGMLGFYWANRHREAVKGIAYMEALVRPGLWAKMDERVRALFQALRSPAGETMVLEHNFYVENMLPRAVLRPLTDEEMEQYRRPFAEPGEGRRPTLTIPRQVPLDGEPVDVAEIVTAYSAWLSQSRVPKLFVNGDPGVALTGAEREFCRSWPEQTEVTVRGLHFLQEDSPDELGQAIATWLKTLK
jgi:haloalkane dehalogenase